MQETQEATSSSEFLQWVAYMRLEAEHPGPLSQAHYMARISMELQSIRGALGGRPSQAGFYYPFIRPTPNQPAVNSKSIWLSAFGISTAN